MNNPTFCHATAMRRAWSLAAGMGVIATLFSLGCQSPGPYPKDAMIPSHAVTLSPGDVVRLTFAGAPEWNQSQTIRADGKLSLPQIGEVRAAGKLVPQFQSQLEELYSSELTNSDVLVTLENGVMSVYVSGAVNKPGKLSFNRPTTVLQVIAEAGGMTMLRFPQEGAARSAGEGTTSRPHPGPSVSNEGHPYASCDWAVLCSRRRYYQRSSKCVLRRWKTRVLTAMVIPTRRFQPARHPQTRPRPVQQQSNSQPAKLQ